MLSYESERRLKQVLLAFSDGECASERLRQRLCEIRDFAPYSAFQRLDRDANESISGYEISNFLRENRIYGVTEAECTRLIKYFDTDEDGRMNFNDFKQMCLPCEDNYLRNLTEDRRAYRVGRFDHLTGITEDLLASVIKSEIDLQNRVEVLKLDLENRHDYTPYSAYRTIDRHNDGAIDSHSLREFLRANGHYASEKELLAIIRRIDTSGNARVSYNEFVEVIRCHDPPHRVALETELKARSYSAGRYSSPLRGSAQKEDPSYSRSTFASSQRNVNRSFSTAGGSRAFTSPAKGSPLRDSILRSTLRSSSGMKTSQPISGSPARRHVSPLRLDVEDDLVRSLREQVSLEREIENAKISLAQRHDFNITDAFNMFDVDCRGHISYSELKYVLNEIGIYASSEEIDLFFRRYDKNGDGRLRFSEFEDAFTPNDSYYASQLRRRYSNHVRPQYRRDDCFLESTKMEFRNTLRTHFKVELAAESLRQRLSKRPGFNVYDAFSACDLNDDGRISKVEIQRLLDSRGFYCSDKEVNNLVEKYDKNKDGRITFSEVSKTQRGHR